MLSWTGNHDWVNPSDELLATLLEELDLDLRDAPDDSDEGAGEAGPARKCRPWHWLQEMRCATSHMSCSHATLALLAAVFFGDSSFFKMSPQGQSVAPVRSQPARDNLVSIVTPPLYTSPESAVFILLLTMRVR